MLKLSKPNQVTRSHKPHENLPGKRSAGNPHAAFEEEGAGNEFQKPYILSKHIIAEKFMEALGVTRQLSTLLKNADKTSESDLCKLIGSDDVIERAYEELNQFNWTEEELLTYEQETKRITYNG